MITTANTPVSFGTGDGVKTSFPLIVGASQFSGTPKIFRNDWQGNLQLSPSPRTNLLIGTLMNGWSGCTAASSASVYRGVVPYTRLSKATSAANENRVNVFGAVSAGVVLTFTVALRASSSGRASIGLRLDGSDWGPDANATATVLEGPATVSQAVGALFQVSSLSSVVDSVVRITRTYVSGGTGSAWIYPDLASSTTLGASMLAGREEVSTSVIAGSYIAAVDTVPASARTITDYTIDANGNVSFGETPLVGATLSWFGAISYSPIAELYALAHKTIVGQYQNSLTLRQLIENFDGNIDPSANFNAFVSMVWNIDTAQGFGLDILGRILNVSRQIDVPAIFPVMVAPGVLSLTDTQYRLLLRAKALTNISGSSAPAINRVLQQLFAGRGNAFVENLGGMHIRYKFLFALTAPEYGIMANSDAVPHPAGVQSEIFSVQPYFGFTEPNSWSTFGEAVFASY